MHLQNVHPMRDLASLWHYMWHDSEHVRPAGGRFDEHGQPGVALPLYISAAGVLAAIVGTLFVRTHEKATQSDLLKVQWPVQLAHGVCRRS